MNIQIGPISQDIPTKQIFHGIKAQIQKFCNHIKENQVKEYVIGIKIKDTDFVYERGIVKISLKEIQNRINSIPWDYNIKLRRPFLKDLFIDELISSTGEKGQEEPEDQKCDIYILVDL